MKCAGDDGKGERGEREAPSPDTRGTLAYRDSVAQLGTE